MASYLIITGGSRGIGNETIATFLEHGWKVINIARTNAKQPDVQNINIDLSSDNWPTDKLQQLTDQIKTADKICLVHNAASMEADNVSTLMPDNFKKSLNLNVVAPAYLNTIVLPHMKPNSAIIYIGSTLSEQAVPGRASYVTSKHAIIGLMRSTCQDLAGKQIITCCVCPGFVNTEMLTGAVDKPILDALISAKVTAQRLIEPKEIADVVYFCATHFVVNGTVLHANLGQVMT